MLIACTSKLFHPHYALKSKQKLGCSYGLHALYLGDLHMGHVSFSLILFMLSNSCRERHPIQNSWKYCPLAQTVITLMQLAFELCHSLLSKFPVF